MADMRQHPHLGLTHCDAWVGVLSAMVLMTGCGAVTSAGDTTKTPVVAETPERLAPPATVPLGGDITFQLNDYYDGGYRLKGGAEVSPAGALVETARQDTPEGGYRDRRPGAARWVWVTLKAQKVGRAEVIFRSVRSEGEPPVVARFQVQITP